VCAHSTSRFDGQNLKPCHFRGSSQSSYNNKADPLVLHRTIRKPCSQTLHLEWHANASITGWSPNPTVAHHAHKAHRGSAELTKHRHREARSAQMTAGDDSSLAPAKPNFSAAKSARLSKTDKTGSAKDLMAQYGSLHLPLAQSRLPQLAHGHHICAILLLLT